MNQKSWPPKPQKMRNFRWPNCAAIYDLTPEAEERLRGEEGIPVGDLFIKVTNEMGLVRHT